MVTLVQGSQWGDEGKGKIIDVLAKDADLVIRYHGGNNAGHTIINDYGTFPLHLIPSGIFHKKATCLITSGVVIDLAVLADEIDVVTKTGMQIGKKLLISPRCHVIMPYHKLLDTLFEEAKEDAKTGTTGRGIGPVYADKVSYNGITLGDMLDDKLFEKKLYLFLQIKNKIISALGGQPFNYKDVLSGQKKLVKLIRPYVSPAYPVIHDALQQKKAILLEGAHGVFLDNDWGTYPFVTASSVVSGSITAGAGIPPSALSRIVGVVKAYTTRVGAGPFPTELTGKDGDDLRTIGKEFGTTTGRPRRCGWFDAELIRFAAELNGYTDLAITKLDVLDSLKTIKVCTGYTYLGKNITYADFPLSYFEKIKPVYKEVPGWQTSTKTCKTFVDLPLAAKNYLQLIEALVHVKISYVSNGARTDEIIIIEKAL